MRGGTLAGPRGGRYAGAPSSVAAGGNRTVSGNATVQANFTK
jgi:hypothetical protein